MLLYQMAIKSAFNAVANLVMYYDRNNMNVPTEIKGALKFLNAEMEKFYKNS